MSLSATLRVFVVGSRRLSSLIVFACASIVVLGLLDHELGVHGALLGLAVAALVDVGTVHPISVSSAHGARPRTTAEERRLRGGFRRQHRPDTPGRPMPRAPGSVV